MRMRVLRLATFCGVATIASWAAPVHADIYTWVDGSGRVNISNLEPPSGAKVTKVTHTSPAPVTSEQEAARLAAIRAAEVQALERRVRELELEAEVVRRVAAMTPPPAPAPVIVQAPPPAMPAYDWAPPAPVYSSYNAPANYGCDPSWFSCSSWWPGFYPSSVVVVNQPRRHFHSVHRRDDGGGFPWRPIMLPHDNGRRR